MRRRHKTGIFCIVLVILLPAILIVSMYPFMGIWANTYREKYKAELSSNAQSSIRVEELYKSILVLYQDLQAESFEKGETEWFLSPIETSDQEQAQEEYVNILNNVNSLLDQYRSNFRSITQNVDYYLLDKKKGLTQTNTLRSLSLLLPDFSGEQDQKELELLLDSYRSYVVMDFDEYGNVKLTNYYGINEEEIYKKLQEENHDNYYRDYYGQSQEFYEINLNMPKNITVIFAFPNQQIFNVDWESDFFMYREMGFYQIYFWAIAFVTLCALLLPCIKAFQLGKEKIFQMPMEFGVIGYGMACSFHSSILIIMVKAIGGYTKEGMMSIFGEASDMVIYGYNFLAWAGILALTYWSATILRPIFQMGLFEYIRKRSFIYQIFPFLKRQSRKLYHFVTDIDLTKKMEKSIHRIVFINFIIVTLISCMWFTGIFGALFYSFLLYLVLRKYFSRLKKQYEVMLKATKQLAEGDLDIQIKENLGVFEPIKIELLKLQVGFKKAVEEEVKSQKMRTELITNVSHDLKTPLTAIITYIDLLKKGDITEEEKEAYINTLDKKSQRLKRLIEDLFEVSKANSKNVTLHMENVDIVSLIKQVHFELEDKMQISGLDFRWNLPEEKVILCLDGQKTFRVLENLIGNILKYAMPNTRVYVDLKRYNGEVQISMKNISNTELNFDPDQITERFVRGDLSRNTEGSGLGLAIVKSFVELQNGTFEIEIDGDLFKVILIWPEKQSEELYLEQKPVVLNEQKDKIST